MWQSCVCEVSVKLLSVKLLYVKFVCVKLVCVKVLYVKLLYVKFVCVCEIIVVVCVREAAGGEGARDTESKTRTPHKVVGNKWLGIPNCNRCSSNLVHSNYIKVPGAACWVALQRSASQFWHAHGTPTAATLTMSSQKWLTIDVYHIKVYHTIWCHMLSYSNWSQRRIQTRTSFSCKSQVTWLVKLRSGTEGHIVWPPFSNCNILIHLALINIEIETTTKHIKPHWKINQTPNFETSKLPQSVWKQLSLPKAYSPCQGCMGGIELMTTQMTTHFTLLNMAQPLMCQWEGTSPAIPAVTCGSLFNFPRHSYPKWYCNPKW